MQLAKRLALVVALVCVGSVGCKKEKKDQPSEKKDEKKEATGSGSGSGTGSGTGSGSATAETKDPAATQAIRGFAAIAATEKAGQTAGEMGGGGFAGTLGGLFGGGGGAEAAAAPVAADKPTGEAVAADVGEGDQPAETGTGSEFDIEFPPPGEKGGDCNAVTDRLMIIIDRMIAKQLGTLSEEERKMAAGMMEEQMKTMRDEVLKMCVDQKWSQELKDCALTASDAKSFQDCEKYAPQDTAATVDTAEPVAVPAYSGGTECKDVGERLRQLTLAMVGDVPPEAKAEVDKALDEQAAQITTECQNSQWPEAWRACVVKADSIDAATACFSM